MSLDIENGYKLGYILYINHASPPNFASQYPITGIMN
jgi:hypothetical protein